MVFLKDVLKKLAITSQQEFEKKLSDRNWRTKNGALHVLDRNDLQLDAEDRIYDDDIDLSNRIIDVNRLCIRNSRRINLRNCIICGDLEISQKEPEPTQVNLDYCIVLGRLGIGNLSEGNNSINLTSVNCDKFSIVNSTLVNLAVSSCKSLYLVIYNSKIESLYTFLNSFGHLTIADSNFNNVTFDYNQTNLQGLIESSKSTDLAKMVLPINHFIFATTIDSEVLDERYERNERLETIDFIKRYTSIASNKESYSTLKYLHSLTSQENWLSKSLIKVLKGFTSPARIIWLALIIYFIFAAFYWLPFSQFIIATNSTAPQSLTIWDSLYYSGITFTTIGYGDITPVGLSKYLAIIEGFLGIIFGSCFVISLVRKYID